MCWSNEEEENIEAQNSIPNPNVLFFSLSRVLPFTVNNNISYIVEKNASKEVSGPVFVPLIKLCLGINFA